MLVVAGFEIEMHNAAVNFGVVGVAFVSDAYNVATLFGNYVQNAGKLTGLILQGENQSGIATGLDQTCRLYRSDAAGEL